MLYARSSKVHVHWPEYVCPGLQVRAYQDTLLGNREEGSFQEALRETAAALDCCAREIGRLSDGGQVYLDVVGTAAFRGPGHLNHGLSQGELLALQQLCAPLADLQPTEMNMRVLTGIEEGALAFKAAAGGPGPCIVIDLGGRSTEVAVGESMLMHA